MEASAARTDLTQLLQAASGGERAAIEQLLPAVYNELRELAHRALQKERSGHTLATTDLVHEAYLRLIDCEAASYQDRAHFFAAAATAMRHLLVDWARARRAQKRGGDRAPISLNSVGEPAAPARAEELIALDEALRRLSRRSDRQARVVECRYFAGLSIDETAAALGVSTTTVKQDWVFARAWLYRDMQDPAPVA